MLYDINLIFIIFRIKNFIEFYLKVRFANTRRFNKDNYKFYKTLYIVFLYENKY